MKKDNKDKIYTCHGCDHYYCDTYMGIREKYPKRHCDYKSHRDCWFKVYQKGGNEFIVNKSQSLVKDLFKGRKVRNEE